MGAIYNIYFECENSCQKPSYCTKQQSIYPSLWQLSPPVQCAHLQSTQQRLEGAPRLAEMSCPGVDLAPLSVLFASISLWPRVFWLPFLSCTWACFRFLFHEILGQRIFPFLFGKLVIITISELEKSSERALSSIPSFKKWRYKGAEK